MDLFDELVIDRAQVIDDPVLEATTSAVVCRNESVVQERKFVLPQGSKDVLVIPVSGGADSTALALLMKMMFPHAVFRYVFTDTGAEPDELYENLDRLEMALGSRIERVLPLRNLYELIEDQGGFLPSSSARWCTRMLKSDSIQAWMASLGADVHVHMMVGIRADETFRVALTLPNTTTHMPFIDLGWKRADVFNLLRQTVGIPRFYRVRSRSGCIVCPFQRRQELIGLLQENPAGFAIGESYEKLSPVDAVRHPPAPSLSIESGISRNWLWIPKPTRYDGLSGRLGCKSETMFNDVGIFIGVEYFWDCAPGGRPFTWLRRVVSFSTTLNGISRQLNTRFEHLLATAEAHDMDEWEVRNRVDFAVFYVEAPSEVFDPEGTGPGSFGWHQGESYAMLRHVTGWAERILAGHVMDLQAKKRDSLPEDSYAWEICDGSAKALQKVKGPLGRIVGMTLYKPREPEIDDQVDERFITCAMCSI